MRIDGFAALQSLSAGTVADIVSRLNVGDVVRAQVLEFTANELLLKLMDGSTMKATSMTTVDAQQGEFVEFLVKSKLENQLLLETVKNAEKKPVEADAELKRQIGGLGLKLTDKNLEIAKQIRLNDLPFTKELFQKLNDTILKFRDMTPAKAAFLEAAGIKPEGANVATLNAFLNGKAQISSNLKEILTTIHTMDDDRVLQTIARKLSPEEYGHMPAATAGEDADKNLILQAREKLGGFPKLSAAIQASDLQGKLVNLVKAAASFDTLSKEKIDAMLGAGLEGYDKLAPAEKAIVRDFLREWSTKFKKEPLEVMDGNVEKNTDTVDKSKEVIQKAFEKLFAKVESDSLERDINVKNLYKELTGKLETVREALAASGLASGSELNQKLDAVQNNLRFMQEINQYSTYVQIPLTIQGRNTTGELYILKRGAQKKRLDPENVTMLISLNTMHIGQVDSLISVSKKSVGVNMRVEDSSLFEMIRESHKELYNRLSEKGYKLVDLKYKLMEEKASLVNIREAVEKELPTGRKSVDFRI